MTGTARAGRNQALHNQALHNQALGEYGERLAERHLVAQGMVVLDRNWRCEAGELDLVLRDGAVLVACEVKTRTSVDYGTPHEAVDAAKLDRLRRLAMRWQAAHGLTAHGLTAPEVRVDLVAVLRPLKGPSAVEHVRGVG